MPETVEGINLLHEEREEIFGEIGENKRATRMLRRGPYKLIWYPCGNRRQLFHVEEDPGEHHDLAGKPEYAEVLRDLEDRLAGYLHGCDEEWVRDGKLAGYPEEPFVPAPDYELYNQRGYHWPPPGGYTNIGTDIRK